MKDRKKTLENILNYLVTSLVSVLSNNNWFCYEEVAVQEMRAELFTIMDRLKKTETRRSRTKCLIQSPCDFTSEDTK